MSSPEIYTTKYEDNSVSHKQREIQELSEKTKASIIEHHWSVEKFLQQIDEYEQKVQWLMEEYKRNPSKKILDSMYVDVAYTIIEGLRWLGDFKGAIRYADMILNLCKEEIESWWKLSYRAKRRLSMMYDVKVKTYIYEMHSWKRKGKWEDKWWEKQYKKIEEWIKNDTEMQKYVWTSILWEYYEHSWNSLFNGERKRAEYKKAIAFYENRNSKHSSLLWLYSKMSWVLQYGNKKQQEEALYYFDKEIALWYNVNGYEEKARFLISAERWEEAEKHINKWLKVAQEYPLSMVSANIAKSKVLFHQWKKEEAEQYLRKNKENKAPLWGIIDGIIKWK